MDDDDGVSVGDFCGDVCGDLIVVCCCGAVCGDDDSHSHSKRRHTWAAVACCCCLLLVLVLALLVAAYAFVVPVRVTAYDAALGRLSLVAAAPSASASGGINGTGGATSAAAAISYDIAVAVDVRNRNWWMAVWRRGPLDAELRFRGRTFARARLAGAAERDKIRVMRRETYHLAAAAEGAPVELGPDGMAELAWESKAGVFDLELAVFGEVHYEAHPRRRAIRVVCPLRLSPSTATAPAAFHRVHCAYV
ncbi:hypothetical protein HU200_000718 [Digitaria exilis]|uniref:Late embryogenesis abundant protein LEA-2 subgroup domain-containing protein n=1 Tax=Digitaria exilis TaxID=1010633 RepID=A0A835L0D5_9POAL|nr:hypothetical protein HU200_000718 [Digitaria exilis]